MSLPPERVDATHDVIYLAKNPLYEVVLERSAPITPDLRSQPSSVQLRFTGQPQQQEIMLPLAALEQFHDAVSRLLDYLRQERARGPAIPASGSSMEGSMASPAEHRDEHSPGDHLAISHPTVSTNRPVSVERLYSLSGIVLTGFIVLLGWALYSLSASQGDFRPLQATAAQETLPRASTPAMPQTNDEARGIPAHLVVGQPPSSGPSSTAKAQDEPPPHIYLHIQSPAQHETAQRLVAQLQQKGYVIPQAAILVPKGPARTEVRYFSPTEAEEATAIAMLLDQPYRSPATPSYIRGRKDASQTRPRRYEVWLGPEPRSRRIGH
jgi:hypothetical protein